MIIKGQEKEDKLEAELYTVKTEMLSMSQELPTLRSKAMTPEVDPLILQKCRVLGRERDELRASLKTAEEQLDALRREVVVLTLKASSVDLGRYMLQSDHANILKQREG